MNFTRIVFTFCFIVAMSLQGVTFAVQPTCILMKFSDDTRYKRIEAADSLSDLVMEKLINSGSLLLKERFPVDENMEEKLYDARHKELEIIRDAFLTKDFNLAFERAEMQGDKSQTLATTGLGQTIEPDIIRTIADAHGADYLIHGTIINLGTGDWWDAGAEGVARVVDTASGLLGMAPSAQALKYLQGISMERTGIGVQCDLRIIDARDGRVVWYKRITSISDQKQYGVALITIGSNKLTSSLYDKAMDKAAKNIVEALVSDVERNPLLLRKSL